MTVHTMKEKMNMIVKRVSLTFAFLLGFLTTVVAQPGTVKKTADAAFTLTTFKADGSILATSNGVSVQTVLL